MNTEKTVEVLEQNSSKLALKVGLQARSLALLSKAAIKHHKACKPST